MFQFPKKFHEIHKFNLDGEMYVADLETGVVVPIDEVIWDILEFSSNLKTDEIIEKLSTKYERTQILESLAKLSKIAQMELLFSPIQNEVDSSFTSERLKIFVTSGFLDEITATSFLLNAANYRLLATLANHAEVYMAFPQTDVEQKEVEKDFHLEGIKPIFFEENRTDSPAKFIPQDCDGILALSPFSYSELFFLRFNSIPVLLRLYNEMLVSDVMNNAVLEKYVALRGYDAIVCDASWVSTFFSQLIPDVSCFHHIPYGVDLSVFRPMNKEESKQKLAQALGNEAIRDLPLIGIIPGLSHRRDAISFLRKLQDANPHLNWLVIHPTLERYFEGATDNISFFSIVDLQDKEASPFIFNALDIMLFPALLGTPSPLLLEVAACGIPLIVWGYSTPNEIGHSCLFVHVEPSLFDRVAFPIFSISEKINFLLQDPNERERLGKEARKAAESYTWDAVAKQILDLFMHLHQKRAFYPKAIKTDLPILFSKYYNRAQDRIESHALEMPHFSEYEVEKGIAITLLDDHTFAEVKALLMHILKEQQRASQIMAEIT